MTAIHWLRDINGSFTNASDWSAGVVPGASDDAILDAVGSSFTVTSGVDEAVQRLQLSANATLSLTGGIFTANDDLGSIDNAGVVLIGAGATMVAGGAVTNSGTIAVYGSGRHSALRFDGDTTLTGGGEILLGKNAIFASDPQPHRYVFLDNLDNTIAGSGTFGGKRFFVTNGQDGVVDANGAKPLVMQRWMDNYGLVEATGGAELLIEGRGGVANSPSGVLLAGDQSTVLLSGAQTFIEGGTIKTVGSGVVIVDNAGLSAGGPGATLTNDGSVVFEGYSGLAGDIVNNGDIAGSVLIYGDVTLSGTGELSLSYNFIGCPNGGSLTVDGGAIRGSGRISATSSKNLALAIGSAGLIDDDTDSILYIGANASPIINAGTIECTGVGGVLIEYSITNSGVVTASEGVLTVGQLGEPAPIVNTGTLSVSNAGTLIATNAVSGKGVARIDGGTLDFASTFNEGVEFTGDTGVLKLSQSQAFTNKIAGFSTKGETTLDLGDIAFVGAGEATFSGTTSGGVLTVTDGSHTAHINFVGDYTHSTFVASGDGKGGVDVVAASGQAPSAVNFVSAMAAMAGHGVAAGLIDARGVSDDRQMMLAAPRLALA